MFKFKAVQPATFEHEIYSVQLFSRENLKNPQMKTQGCFDTRFFACLTFSSKWVTFFSKDSSNFRQYFGGVFLKSVLFILCFLQTLETKRCWLWRAFAHVSPTLRSESFGIYIYIHYSVRKINSCFKHQTSSFPACWTAHKTLFRRARKILSPKSSLKCYHVS